MRSRQPLPQHTGMRRLRLLVATPFPPSLDGAHGGSRVISQFLTRMAERHDIALVCLRHRRDPEVDPLLRSRLARVEEVERPDWRPDIVQLEYSVMGTYLRELEAAGVPIVLVEPDPASHAALDLQRVSRRNRLLRRLDVLAWKQFEPDVLHRVAAAD